MSASLVGSEMCIRDRPGTAASAAEGAPGAGPWRPCLGPPRPSPAVGSTCLLYTSDAADDM
eukprot:7917688-Alexandrium_andersonii.AAC.1